uniref:LAGLIDADG endonuclease n=1 Tax=Ramaria cf. rubripermanens TaxID=2016387 RepID=UPI00223709F0
TKINLIIIHATKTMKTMNQNLLMSGGYITGLTQTNGSFFCSIILSSKHRFGLQFRPKFTITADLNSKYVLDSIHSYFGCGKVTINNKNYTAEFEVVKLEDLKNNIIPHFKEFPVFFAKLHAFNLFSEIVFSLFMFNKDNRSLEGRIELLRMGLSMNVTTNRKEDRIDLLFSLLDIKDEISKFLIPNNITAIETSVTSEYISGIIDGDGSLFISFQKNGTIKTGFNITSDISSRPLLEIIQTKLKGIGSINEGTKNDLVFTVSGLNQITDVLIPFIDSNPLFSERALHYEKFKKVSLLLRSEKPLTLEKKITDSWIIL